jgi:hypothetical protein
MERKRTKSNHAKTLASREDRLLAVLENSPEAVMLEMMLWRVARKSPGWQFSAFILGSIAPDAFKTEKKPRKTPAKGKATSRKR